MDFSKNEEYTESIITLDDFPFICRICCLKCSDLRLFQDESHLFELFHLIRKIDVHSTLDFPKNVCNGCINELAGISLFIDASKDNNDRSFGKNMEPKNGNIECNESGLSRKSIKTIAESGEDMFLQGPQICRICSTSSPTLYEEKTYLMHLFENITKIDGNAGFSKSKMNNICNKCNNELEKISSYVTSSLSNDQKLQQAIGRKKTVNTENYSNPINIELSMCQELKLESFIDRNETMPENSVEEISFFHDSKVKLEIIDIKEEIIDNEIVSSTDNEVHLITGSVENPFRCGHCNESFAKKWNLQQHLLIHRGVRSFESDCCEKSFNQKSNLQQRMFTHTREKSFKCDCCEKKFRLELHLQVHMLTHTGEKSFKCDCCEKKFMLRQHLQVHMLTHTDNKSFECGYCEKSFNLKSNLQQHMFTHTREKLFKCDCCKKKFMLKQHLQYHMLTHTGNKSFKCGYCEKSFILKSNLQQHMFIHTREKLFECDYCERKFRRKYHLQRHRFIHTGEKSFKCDYCGNKFGRKQHLQRHLLTHGKKNYSNVIISKKVHHKN